MNAGCARTASRSRAPAALAQPIRSNPMQPEFYLYRNNLVYRGYDDAVYRHVLNSIKTAYRIRFDAIAVPRTLYNSQLLRRFNLPVASHGILRLATWT